MGIFSGARGRTLAAAGAALLALAPPAPRALRAEQALPARALSAPVISGSTPAARGTSGWNPPGTTGPFVVPGALRAAVDFWKQIFTRYTTEEAVIHHAFDLSTIYATLDFRDLRGHPRAERLRKARIAAEISQIRRRHPGLREEDIHVQYGIRDRFERGLIVSHRYLPEIERIFREEGLPLQLTRLPFVESSFNVNAVSKAGASGIWQFMPATGRLYMRVGTAVDERNDPIIASRGAAQLLRHNYEATGRWSLALTAYNHGLGGVMRAVRVTGSRNIVDIIRNYREASFGFASRNFYAEFLAALEVDRDYRKHFGPLPFDRPFSHDEIRLRSAMVVSDLLRAGLSRDEMESYNPSLTSAGLSGRAPLPSGTALRVPLGRGERIVAALEGVAPVRMSEYSGTRTERHHVRRGETIRSVASRYGVSRSALARANGLSTRAKLRRGQVLRVPIVVRVSRPVIREASGGRYENAVLVRRSDPSPVLRDATRIASAESVPAISEAPPGEDGFAGEAIAPQPPSDERPDWRQADLGAPHGVDATGLLLGGAAPASASVSPARSSASPTLVAAERIEPPDMKTRVASVAPPSKPVAPPPAPLAGPVVPRPPAAPPAPVVTARSGPVVTNLPVVKSPAPPAVLPAAPSDAELLSSPGAVPASEPAPRSSAPDSSARSVGPARKPLSSPGAVIGALPAKAAEVDQPDLDPEEPDRPPRQITARRSEARHITHVVRRNETLWDIARRYDVPVSSVRRANPGKKLTPLMPGTRLRIPVKTGRT